MTISRQELLDLSVVDNSYTRTFDFNAEMEDSSSGFTDAITSGLAASVVSGGVGILNTGISVGQMFGADIQQLKTEDILKSWDWDDTYDYYLDNKEVVDAVGFAVSTLVPGLGGLKAAKYAQAAAKANQSKNLLATGLRKILVPEDQMKKVSEQIAKDTMHVANRSTVTRMAGKQGFHQAAVETAFAETAILLSTNQHVTVNDNQLGYFEAMWEQKDGFMVGFGLGTGIGGVVGAAVNARAINSLVDETQKSHNRMFQEMTNMDSRSQRVGFVQGNKVAELSSRYKESVEKFGGNLDGAEAAEFARREKELFNDLFEEVAVLTDEASKKRTPLGRREITGHLSPAIMELVKKGNAEEVADMFRGAARVGKYDDFDFLFDPAAQPLVVADTVGDFSRELGTALYGRDYTDAILAANRTPEQKHMIAAVAHDAATARGISVRIEGTQRFRKNIINKSLIGAMDDMAVTDPAHILGTIRHEIGHGNTIFQRTEFKPYVDEMEKLSRSQRPSSWAIVDNYTKRNEQLLAQPSRSLDEIKEITSNQQWIDYMRSPEELLADSWAQFNAKDAGMRKLADELAPQTRAIMEGNGALKTRLGKTERLLSLKNGKMYEEAQWAPTIADRGTPSMKGNVVSAGNTGYKINADNFSILNTTPDEASAYYFAASQSKVKMKKVLEVKWDNFYMLNRIQKGLDDKSWAGKVTVKMPDDSTRVIDMDLDSNALTDFDRLYTDLKTEAATKLNQRELNKRNHTYGEIGRIIDTDEDFALSVGADPSSARYWSRDNDPTKPTVAKVFYQTAHDETGAASNALADAIQQNTKVLEVNDDMINSFLADFGHGLSDGNTGASLAQMAPEPSWVRGVNGGMQDITRHNQLTGTFKTFVAEFGESTSKGQAIGKFNELVKLKGNEQIQTLMANVAQKVSSDVNAVMEMNVLDSRLRQQMFKFAPKLDSSEGAVGYLATLVDRVPQEIAAKNVERLMKSATGQKLLANMGKDKTIWTRDVEALLTKIVNQKKYIGSNESKLNTMLDSDLVQIQHNSVFDFWQAKIQANRMIVDGKKVAAAARGYASNLDEGVLYPGALNVTKYKHRKYVVPMNEEVWSHNQKGIIGASTPTELAQKEAQVLEQFGSKVKIVSKEEMESSFQRSGEFLEDFSLNEFQTNRDLARKGVNWDVAPEANEGLIAHYVNDTAKDWAGTVDNLTELKYAEEFAALQQMDGVAQVFGTKGAGTQEIVDTSFREMQNIMLNRTTRESSKSWRDAQQAIDKTITSAFDGLSSAFRASEKSGDYSSMDKYMEHYGIPRVYEGQAGEMLRTSTKLTDQALKELVPKMNGIAATLMLRLDFIQPMVNALSMPIMSVPEMNTLMRSIPQIRAQQLGQGLSNKVPGTEFTMGNNIKLQMQSVKDFFSPEGKEILKRYYDEGIVSNVVREMRQVADDITIDTTMAAESIKAKVGNAAEKVVNQLAKPADYAEDFVKFVAARQAELLLDAADITDKSIRSATLRTYTTRVHGNYVSAQRPAVFQGFAGQAIGLFQTYQFNLIQSLLTKMGDKNVVAVSAMMGIQGGMFGVQSVPGFKAMNNYIAMQSEEGNDFYTGVQALTGDEESEWMLFGLASNFTKPVFGEGMELYTRGDLNPRTPFILPTSMAEIPIYSLSTKFVGNILNAAKDLSQGVDAGQVMADTLAHNGVNRPLAGVGAILAGNRTTSKGTLVADLSDISWFAKAARAAGTKTLDESIAVQSFYRTKAYDTKRNESLQNLGRAAKRMIQSGDYDEGTYNNFVSSYASSGGRPEQFNKWMHQQALGATESTIFKLYESNNSHSGRYLQKIMGNSIEDYIGTHSGM